MFGSEKVENIQVLPDEEASERLMKTAENDRK